MIADRARVRHVGEQRAERDDHLRAERLGEVDDRAGRTCASASTARCPASRIEVARRARDARGVDLDLGPLDLARARRRRADLRARRLEVEELLGVDRREARAPSEAPTKRSAAEAASPASFQPLNAHTSAGARRPSGRLSHSSGCIRFTVHDGPRALLRSPPCAPGQEVAGVFACTRKDRLTARTGSPYLAVELRDRDRRASPARAFRDADVLAGRFERGDLVRVRGPRRALPRRAAGRAVGHRPAPRPRRRRPAAFLPVAYRDLDELDGFLEHLAARGPRPAATRRCSDGLLGDERAARRVAARAVHARRPPRLPRRAARAHRRGRAARARDLPAARAARTATCSSPRRSCTTSARRASSRYGAEIAVTDEGRLLGHVELGLRAAARARRRRARPRAAARAVALRADPPRAGPRAGAALRLGRGARAVPAQRARRDGQGRARARSRLTGLPRFGIGDSDVRMERELFALLWTDDDGAQCAIYEAARTPSATPCWWAAASRAAACSPPSASAPAASAAEVSGGPAHGRKRSPNPRPASPAPARCPPRAGRRARRAGRACSAGRCPSRAARGRTRRRRPRRRSAARAVLVQPMETCTCGRRAWSRSGSPRGSSSRRADSTSGGYRPTPSPDATRSRRSAARDLQRRDEAPVAQQRRVEPVRDRRISSSASRRSDSSSGSRSGAPSRRRGLAGELELDQRPRSAAAGRRRGGRARACAARVARRTTIRARDSRSSPQRVVPAGSSSAFSAASIATAPAAWSSSGSSASCRRGSIATAARPSRRTTVSVPPGPWLAGRAVGVDPAPVRKELQPQPRVAERLAQHRLELAASTGGRSDCLTSRRSARPANSCGGDQREQEAVPDRGAGGHEHPDDDAVELAVLGVRGCRAAGR